MIPRAASKLWWRRYLSRNAARWDELEQFPRLRPDEQRQELAARLFKQIRYFGSREDALPEWREAARILRPDDLWRVWPSLPILDKQTLRDRFPAAEIGRRFQITGKVDSTGGSTGEPLCFFHDQRTARHGIAAGYYSAMRAGWAPGMPTIIVWGSERDIRKQMSRANRIQGALRNEFLIDGYRLTDETVERVYALARRMRPVAIYGFTSMLEFVARRGLEQSRSLPAGSVRTAWNGGEMLSPHQSELFRDAFGVPVLNRYGGRELSTMAFQHRFRGPLHVLRPWLFLEIVDAQGRPAAPGESGRLIWTSTLCKGTPFLRYDVGDLGSFTRQLQDESGIWGIDQLHGRFAGLLTLPNGSKINNLYWNHLFKEYAEVRQFQVTLKSDGRLRILLKGEGFREGQQGRLTATLRHFLGEAPIEFRWVDEIPRTPQGKLVQVINESLAKTA